ncbi:GNAT family N-acetyltransferase [Streptomyces sp. Z26]|uniref:GNAT family N-acetyltransferase n=1 Tax=Streptomyces TaxID=1883 RepID=UPI000EF133B1|nr:GNAT family N-acetyltransferase [Streptomyces sp. Z26]RLL67569.1 N-acetyltransferase [Streptomyces sp. Z26]
MSFSLPPAIPPGSLAASPQPTLTSRDGTLRLRPWEPADAEVLHGAFRDPAIRRWHVRHVASLPEAREWITAYGVSWREERAAQYAVARADDGAVVGRVALRGMDLRDGVAECGYWVLPAARGTGVAPRALGALTRWALGTAGFHRLELAHSVANTASCRVAAKSGFPYEGTRRGAHVHADGRHDMHLHARVVGDPPPA